MRIYIGADHRGFELKNKLADFLRQQTYDVVDKGNTIYDADDDYPIFADAVARAVAQDRDARGIVVCGSGVGVDIAANKVDGVRAGLCQTPEQATAARRDDNINVLALAADFVDDAVARAIAGAFVSTQFDKASRHQRRVDEIGQIS